MVVMPHTKWQLLEKMTGFSLVPPRVWGHSQFDRSGCLRGMELLDSKYSEVGRSRHGTINCECPVVLYSSPYRNWSNFKSQK